MKKVKWVLVLAAVQISFNLSAQQLGDLDSTFNLNGKVITNFNADDGATSMIYQPDGKIVVGGYSGTGSAVSFALARYNQDGTPDSTFGVTGKVIADFAVGYDFASCLALQPDGKIVAGGSMYAIPSYDNALIRLNPDGSIDSTFGINGKVHNSIGIADGGITSIAIQPDGKIVASCMVTDVGSDHNFGVARYDSTGALDNTFGIGGMATFDFLNASSDFPFSVKLQSDGKVIVSGASGIDPNFHFGMLRLDTLGNIDTTFGINGYVTTNLGGNDETAYSSVIQNNGKIILAGYSGSPYKVALARYNDDGTLDQTFNGTGKVLSAHSTHDEASAVTIDSVGNIVVAGYSTYGSNQNFFLNRYLTNGTLDNAFGLGGWVTTDFGTNNDKAKAIAVQPDTKIIVAGVAGLSGSDFATARYLGALSTGIIDFATMNNSVLIYPNPIVSNATLTYTLKQAEKITIRLTDVQGKIIKTFIQDQMKSAAEHHQIISLDHDLQPGIYFIVIANEHEHLSIKVVK